jgi:hypothetical protein
VIEAGPFRYDDDGCPTHFRGDPITVDPGRRAAYFDMHAQEGDVFDLVLDVRPAAGRKATPYPGPCVEVFADELVDDRLGELAEVFSPGTARVCCVCWSGNRALRCVYLMRARGWRHAYWWALSPVARAAFEPGNESVPPWPPWEQRVEWLKSAERLHDVLWASQVEGAP